MKKPSQEDRVRRFEHLDYKASELAKPEVTQDGFWKLEGKVARTGVQVYHDGLGGTRREMRRPEDVKASLPGFNLTPLTNGHPPTLVDPTTAKEYAAGAVGEASYADGWVRAPITVWTADAIDAIRSGRAQLSVGYTCRLIDEDGEHLGEKYDSVQTEIQVNHVALVDAARAGPEARLRLDATDAASADFGRSTIEVIGSSKSDTQQETTRMLTIKLDSLDVKVESANDQAIIEKSIAQAKKDGEALAAIEKKRADDAIASLATKTSEISALQAKHDALEAASKVDVKCDECDGSGKVGEKGCSFCEGKGTMKADALTFEARRTSRARSELRAIAERGDARAKLLAQVAPHLSKNAKLDGKTDVEIKKMLLTELVKDLKLDGKDDVYVSAYFDAEMKRLEDKVVTPIERVRLKLDGSAPPPALTGEEELSVLQQDEARDRKAEQKLYFDSMYWKHPKHKEIHGGK